jgi:OOP family OmpA-OmpF porin
MASPFLDGVMSIANPTLGNVASQLGESPQAVATGMRSGIAAILAGLVHKAGDPGAMNQVVQASANIDPNAPLSDPAAQLTAGSSPATSGLLSVLFGGRAGGIGDLIAHRSGMKSSSANALLTMAVPIVLGFLKRQSGGTLSAASLSSTLMGQRDAIMSDAPTGLGSLLGVAGAGSAAAGAAGRADADVRSNVNSARIAAADIQSPTRSLVGPLLVILGLAIVGWFLFGRDRTASIPAATTTASAKSTIDSLATKMGAAAGAAAGSVANLGAFVKRSLPGGAELNVPDNGIESRLLSFITDGSRAVSDTVWFNFDRLLFETGSSRLTPESKEQVDNIAAILKAYPAVNIKLGGYTDNVGNPAENLKLSSDRANRVRTDLITQGIEADRLTAEGYGEKHPVRDNSTPAGREQNRRIAIRVTKK